MKCTRFLGHKWTKWHKRIAATKKDAAGRLVSSILLIRRCASCGYIEEVYTNSCHIIKEAPEELNKGE